MNLCVYWFPPNEPEASWPVWMGEDLPEVGVWSLGYENAALKPRRFSLIGKILQRILRCPSRIGPITSCWL